VTTWGELKEVESGDWASLDTWDVSESLDETLVLVVDDERTTSLPVTPVPHLSLTGTDLSGVGNLDDVGVSLDRLEELDGDLGLGDGLGGVGNDEWDLLDLLDTVTTGEDKGRESRCGKSRGNGVSALTLVDLDVPLPPGLGRSEHPSTSAHVTESGLSGPLGTTTGDTGDTSDGTTGTPRFSRGLMTGVLSDGVCLTPVLVHGLCY
jgi:hypothetical protein